VTALLEDTLTQAGGRSAEDNAALVAAAAKLKPGGGDT